MVVVVVVAQFFLLLAGAALLTCSRFFILFPSATSLLLFLWFQLHYTFTTVHVQYFEVLRYYYCTILLLSYGIVAASTVERRRGVYVTNVPTTYHHTLLVFHHHPRTATTPQFPATYRPQPQKNAQQIILYWIRQEIQCARRIAYCCLLIIVNLLSTISCCSIYEKQLHTVVASIDCSNY